MGGGGTGRRTGPTRSRSSSFVRASPVRSVAGSSRKVGGWLKTSLSLWIWTDHERQSTSLQIYSSAYDGTLRVTHFETGMSEEVINGDHWEENALIHSFDFDPTGNQLWGTEGLLPSPPGRTFFAELRL